MFIYLSARYGRKQEIAGVADRLRKLGHTVTSRWIAAPDQPLADEEMTAEQRWAFAEANLVDLLRSNVVVAFTETGDAPGAARGGRHVEWGFALGHAFMNMGENLKLFVVGPMENIFYAVPDVKAFSDADALLAHLADREGGR